MRVGCSRIVGYRSSLLLLGLFTAFISGCGGDGDAQGAGDSVSLEPHFFEGPYELSGTVTFASTLPEGTLVQLNLAEATGFPSGALDFGNELRNQKVTATNTVGWTIEHISAGSFTVALSAELSGDGWIGEGDQGGYYGGTVEQPAQYEVDAAVIEVSGTMSGLDFGAGPMQCKAHWGDPCEMDDDCRGIKCNYDSGASSTRGPGVCTAGVCEPPLDGCVPLAAGESGGTPEEPGCFGGL